MIQYRDFMSMSNQEVIKILTDLFGFMKLEVLNIQHDYTYKEIRAEISTQWDNDMVIDEVVLDENTISAPFSLNSNDYNLYQKYLLAKGMNELFKNNPYLGENNDEDILSGK